VSETRTRVTTSGLDIPRLATLQSWHVTVDGETGSGFSARAFETRAEHAARLDRVLQTAALLREGAPAFSGGLLPVVLHPDVVEDLVLATLLHHLDAATVAHGEGRFRREQFGSGRPVLREDLTLRLDPLRPLGAGSYRFTREGLPAAGCTYVDRGALVTPVADFKYARRLGIPPTPLPYGHEALFLEGPRPLTTTQAFAEAEGGALVLNVLGIHTLDAASGDFSLSAPQVLTIGPFGPRGRIRATISGNLFDLLRSEALRLVAFEGEHVPGLLVSCRLDPRA
jgi:PmbA protein